MSWLSDITLAIGLTFEIRGGSMLPTNSVNITEFLVKENGSESRVLFLVYGLKNNDRIEDWKKINSGK